MKKVITLLFVLILLFSSRQVVAQTSHQKDIVSLPKGHTINENYFATGDSVTLSGIVNGDAYVAGGNIFVDGEVNGDLLVSGGTVTVDGVINGDVRAAGGQININGTVTGNITVFGGNITIAKDAVIQKGLVGAGGQVSILSPIGGGITLGAGNVVIGNSVNGNVLVGVGKLVLTPEAVIQGDLNYYSEEKAELQPEASVAGMINYHEQHKSEEKAKKVGAALLGIGVIYKLYTALVAFIIGLLFIYMFPKFIKKSSQYIQDKPLTTMGTGLLILLGLPIVILLFAITILGIPFALVLFLYYLVVMYIAKIFVAFFIGKHISNALKWKESLLFDLALGLIAWTLLTFIPVLGGIIQFVVLITGIGTVFLTKRYFFETMKSKDLL